MANSFDDSEEVSITLCCVFEVSSGFVNVVVHQRVDVKIVVMRIETERNLKPKHVITI